MRSDIAICIASFRRPRGLDRLLDAIAGQELPEPAPAMLVVVADNDAAGSAREVARAERPGLARPVAYVVEPRRGIPQARNAALAVGLERAEWIAFVDDDEVPEPGWLAALIDAQRRSGADAVTGPVVPDFERPPPGWVLDGRFFGTPPAADGTPVATAATNNALVRAKCLRDVGARFDEGFVKGDIEGVGEDNELFERLAARGATIVWAAAAVVRERVPPDRATLRWLLARGRRCGRARTRIDRLHRRPSRVARVVREALGSLLSGAFEVAFGHDLGARARGLQILSYAAGRVQGLFDRH